MNKYLAAYLAALAVILALDALWLGLIATSMYQAAICHLMAETPNKLAGGLFYLLYPAGVLIFAVLPQAGAGSAWGCTVLMGALFGFFAYATYDLTNLATLKGWPVGIALIDVAWGAAISGAAAAASKAAMNWAGKLA